MKYHLLINIASLMKILMLFSLFAVTQSSLKAQLLSYDFEDDGVIFRNEGSLDSPFDLKSSVPVAGSVNSGVGGHGQALDLTGSPEMGGAEGLQLFSAPNEAFPAQKAISVTGWFKTASGSPIYVDKNGVVFIRASGRDPYSGFLVGSASDGRLSMFIGDGGAGVYLSSENGAFAEEGSWVFFAVTWDGETGKWAWYVGSEKDKIREAGTGMNPATMTDAPVGSLRVGRSNSASGAFKGMLDHLHVYDRALSESEIEKIRSAQVSGH